MGDWDRRTCSLTHRNTDRGCWHILVWAGPAPEEQMLQCIIVQLVHIHTSPSHSELLAGRHVSMKTDIKSFCFKAFTWPQQDEGFTAKWSKEKKVLLHLQSWRWCNRWSSHLWPWASVVHGCGHLGSRGGDKLCDEFIFVFKAQNNQSDDCKL